MNRGFGSLRARSYVGLRELATRVLLTVSVLLGGVLGAGCGGRGTAVQSPFSVTAAPSITQTEQAVLGVLAQRHWQVELTQPGRVVAHLDVRRHQLRVDIRYDAQQVSVYYADSSNLKARVAPDGRIYAHPKVNQWLQNLAMDIGTALAVAPPATSGGSYLAPGSSPPPSSYPPAGEPTEVPGAPPGSQQQVPATGVH